MRSRLLNCLWLFLKAWRPCHHISIRKRISQLLSKASAVCTWTLCRAQTLLLTFRWSKSSLTLKLFFYFNYELLEKPAVNSNQFVWRLTHRLCCDYNDFLRGRPNLRVVDYPVAFARPVCKSFQLNQDPFDWKSWHSETELQFTCTVVHYYITDLPSIIVFRSPGNNVSFIDF